MENNETEHQFKVGDIVVGKVSGIQDYGAFVTFDNGYRGLIHISEISSKFVRSIADYVVVGGDVRVKVIDVDESNHNLKLSLKQVSERERQIIKPKTLLKKTKVKIPESECDFTPLKEKLPQWINEALKGDK